MQSALPEQLGETRKAFGVSLAALAAAHPGQKLPREQQARPHGVAASATWGCSLGHIGLQPRGQKLPREQQACPRLLHYGYSTTATPLWLCYHGYATMAVLAWLY